MTQTPFWIRVLLRVLLYVAVGGAVIGAAVGLGWMFANVTPWILVVPVVVLLVALAAYRELNK